MRIWVVWALGWAVLIVRVASRVVGRAVADRSLVEFRRFREVFGQPSPPGSEVWSPCGRQFRSVRVLGGDPGSKGRAA